MAGFLSRFIDLREGEAEPVRASFVLLAGIIAGHTMLETARDALFLTKLPPARLTLVYVIVAAATFGAAGLSSAFVRRFGQKSALVFTLLAAAYGTAVLHFVEPTPAALFALYTWSALLGTMLSGQFWMLAGQLFTVAQGKRLFGPIAAGGIAGAVCGAGGAAIALSVVPVGSLLLASAALFLATAVFLTTFDVAAHEAPEEIAKVSDTAPPSVREVAPASTAALERESTIGMIARHPYLRRMALITVLSTAALLVTDYLFKSVASQRVPAAELGAFFARTYAVLNAVSLAVQLLLAGRILRQLGVVPALFLLPLLLTFGSAGVLVTGGALALAVATKGADGALRHSLHRVGSELLWMPVPAELRDRARGLLDSGGTKLVQATVAALLLLLGILGGGTPRVLAALGAALAAAWIVASIELRSGYLDLFRKALSRGVIDVRDLDYELDLAPVEAVLDALSSREPKRVVATMEMLRERGWARIVPALVLYHESDEVVRHALRLGGAIGRREWTPMVVRLLAHPAEPVRIEAVRVLASFGEHAEVEKARADASPAVRAHAAFCLALRGAGADVDADGGLDELLSLPGDAGRAAAVALLEAIGDRPDERFADRVLALAGDPRPTVSAAAVAAMAKIRAPSFIPFLVGRLAERAGRAAAREALLHQGDAALDALAASLREPGTPRAVRVHVPRTIARFESPRSIALLTEALENDGDGVVRYKALRGLGRLARRSLRVDRGRFAALLRRTLTEHLRLCAVGAALDRRDGVVLGSPAEATATLLADLVADERRRSFERAFRLLSILNPSEDLRRAHQAVLSPDRRLRAQAIEFLDALTISRTRGFAADRETRELVRLAVDDLPLADRAARARPFLGQAPSTHEEAVLALLESDDALLARFAEYHAMALGTPALVDRALRASTSSPMAEVADGA
jgi:hypothetical protein